MADDPLAPIIQELRLLRKYRSVELPEETVRDLLVKEMPLHRNPKDAVQEVRKKLHNIVAPYLGDPDYAQAALDLETAFQAGGPQPVREVCSRILSSHASTRERIKILDTFYPTLFNLTGQPGSILDLACGLNPLTFPWMGLPTSLRYYAFDLHRPRVSFINRFFQLQGLPELAEYRDILVDLPRVSADVAFIFKEAHRFEQRQRGVNRVLWDQIPVRFLLVSLPPHSLSGQHDLADKERRLVYSTLEGKTWKVDEVLFENELVFVIDKG